MSDSIIKQLAQDAGATDVINGSWLAAFADAMGVSAPVNGSWWQAIGEDLGLSAVNGSWIQAIAEHYGATDPVNGSWLQALLDNISFVTLPVNTVAPAITGTAEVGQTLTCSTGTWSGSPTSYAYQWKRGGVNIGGATNSTYVLVAADEGESIKCTVTATNGAGSASADSNTVTPTWEADAQAFITAASITDPTQQEAVNQLVVDLKGYSLWTKMKAVYPMVGSSSSQMKWNLKDPRDLDAAYRLIFSGGWTFSQNGAKPNGTNSWANTKLDPTIAFSSNSASIGYYSRTNSAVTSETAMGVLDPDGSNGLNLVVRRNTDLTSFRATETSGVTGLVNSTATDGRGLFCGSITAANSRKIYRNGTLLNTNSSSVTWDNNTGNVNIVIGAAVTNDPPAYTVSSYTDKECAFAYIADGLSDTEAANLYTAVQTFQTTLGRSIGTQTVSDSDAQAFVTAASITDQVEAEAVNQLVIDLKAASLWSKGDVILPIVGGNATAHRVDLKTATNKVTWAGGITHDSTGVLFNGSTGYGNVDWAAPNTYDRTAAEWSKYYFSVNNGWSGAYNGVNAFGMQCQIVSASQQRTVAVGLNNLQGALTYDDSWGLRTSVVSANGTNGAKHYANGNQLHQATPNATPTGINYYVGALNNSGSPILNNNRLQQFFFFGSALSGSEVSQLAAIVSDYQIALSR